jgi:hypothetical protein
VRPPLGPSLELRTLGRSRKTAAAAEACAAAKAPRGCRPLGPGPASGCRGRRRSRFPFAPRLGTRSPHLLVSWRPSHSVPCCRVRKGVRPWPGGGDTGGRRRLRPGGEVERGGLALGLVCACHSSGPARTPGRLGISKGGVGWGGVRESSRCRRLRGLLPLWSPGRRRRRGGGKSPETQRSPRRGWSWRRPGGAGRGAGRREVGEQAVALRAPWRRRGRARVGARSWSRRRSPRVGGASRQRSGRPPAGGSHPGVLV